MHRAGAATFAALLSFLAAIALAQPADTGERFVAEHDPDTGELRLSAPLEDELPAGTAFEVLSPEEAPVLAARPARLAG